MEAAVNSLVKIFKRRAKSESTTTDEQRVKRANAHCQRVALEEAEAEAQRGAATNDVPNAKPIEEDGGANQRAPPIEIL